jgi:hypothetical protein
MQVDQKRICAACGSESAPDASFCWRCLTPFAQVPPPPAIGVGHGSLPPTPAPGPWATPGGSVETRRGPSKLARAVVAAVAGVGGYLGIQYLLGSGVSLPASLAGAERLTDKDSKDFEQYTADEGDRYGIDAEGGVYGSSSGPEFFVILVDAAAVETTDQLFDALVSGFAQAGATVDEAGATSGERDGSEYRCVSASANGASAVACMWRDRDNVGIVFQAPGSLKGTRRLLWTVHDTVTA